MNTRPLCLKQRSDLRCGEEQETRTIKGSRESRNGAFKRGESPAHPLLSPVGCGTRLRGHARPSSPHSPPTLVCVSSEGPSGPRARGQFYPWEACHGDNGRTAFRSLGNGKEVAPRLSRRGGASQPPGSGRPASGFGLRAGVPAFRLEGWFLPDTVASNVLATGKTKFRDGTKTFKNTIVLWSSVNRSKFFKTDVFVP